jgi:hypothetical protein
MWHGTGQKTASEYHLYLQGQRINRGKVSVKSGGKGLTTTVRTLDRTSRYEFREDEKKE